MFRCRSCGSFNRVPQGRTGVPTCGRCKADLDVSGVPQDVDAVALSRAVASSPVPVLVDVWAPWCAPCRMAAPMLERVARERAGSLLVLKVNSDEHPEPSAQLGIQGIPTFVVFKEGREVARQAGVPPGDGLSRWVSSLLR